MMFIFKFLYETHPWLLYLTLLLNWWLSLSYSPTNQSNEYIFCLLNLDNFSCSLIYKPDYTQIQHVYLYWRTVIIIFLLLFYGYQCYRNDILCFDNCFNYFYLIEHNICYNFTYNFSSNSLFHCHWFKMKTNVIILSAMVISYKQILIKRHSYVFLKIIFVEKKWSFTSRQNFNFIIAFI